MKKRSATRPLKYDESLRFRCPEDLRSWLVSRAAERKVTVSDAIRSILTKVKEVSEAKRPGRG